MGKAKWEQYAKKYKYELMNVMSYHSMVQDEEQALRNAFKSVLFSQKKKPKANKLPVLFDVTIQNGIGKDYFRLNSPEYSFYPNDNEILLFEGVAYIVNKVQLRMAMNPQSGKEE